MRTKNLKCVILGHKNFGECDKLIFFYNDNIGKFTAVAKGARKISSKFIGHLETLNFCLVSIYFGKNNNILTEINTEKNYFHSRDNFSALKNALQIANITNRFVFEKQSLHALTHLLEETLKSLETSPKKELIKIAYIIKLLEKAGLLPDFKETKLPLKEKYLRFFSFLKSYPLNEIEKIHLTKKEHTVIKNFLNQILEQETSSHLLSL